MAERPAQLDAETQEKTVQCARASRDWFPYQKYQKYCRQELSQAEWQYINTTIQEGLDRNNTKPFWSFIKPRKQDSPSITPLKENDKLFGDSQSEADILLKQFKSVFTKDTNKTLPNLPPPPPPISSPSQSLPLA